MTVELRVGEYLISVVDDHIGAPRDVTTVYPEVPLADWDPFRSIAFNDEGRFQSQWRGHLVRKTDGSGPKILVDAGMGPGPHDHTGRNGELLDNLRKLEVDPGEIDAVVTTHCHGDHIGWNVSYNGDAPQRTFAAATHYIAANDWNYYSKPDVDNDMFDKHVAPLESLGGLQLVKGVVEIAPGVSTLPTNGHTPGHQCVLVQSGGETAVLTGDLFHNVAQVTEQSWCPSFDWRTDLSTASRRWLMWRAQAEEWTVVSGHLPTGKSMGRIVEEGGKTVWKPI